MSRRQTEGSETWRRLLEWDRGQAPSERLAAHILLIEGYKAVDPSHPLGGQDGLKDIVCMRDTQIFIGACFFPRGKQSFNVISKKFIDDLEGVEHNSACGIAFITNQELALDERRRLSDKASPALVDLFHLERVASILDSPPCYGIRLEFLDIELTREEQLAFMANFSQISDRLEEILGYISKSETLREEFDKLRAAQDEPKMPNYVAPALLNNPYMISAFGNGDSLKTCPQCGYGYVAKGVTPWEITPVTLFGQRQRVVTCPKCRHTEYV